MRDTPTNPKSQGRHGNGAFAGGALDAPAIEAALAMLESGLSQKAVARRFGVSKNTIAGLWHRHGSPQIMHPAKTTMAERLEALHARLDAVLAATLGVGRIPESERKPR